MSKNSFVRQITDPTSNLSGNNDEFTGQHEATHLTDWTSDADRNPLAYGVPLIPAASALYKSATKGDAPDLMATPGAPEPGKVRQQQIEAQLQQEVKMRNSGSAFGSGGLLDSQPFTASRVLLGS